MRVPEQAEEADWGAANAVADAMAAGQPASAELLLRTAAGGHLWAQVRACAHPHNPTTTPSRPWTLGAGMLPSSRVLYLWAQAVLRPVSQ